MATVEYTTPDRKFVLRIHTALHGFLLAFGQDIQYQVQRVPPGLPRYGHIDARPCHAWILGTPGKELYISFTSDRWKTEQHYRLFTNNNYMENAQAPGLPALVLQLPAIENMTPEQHEAAVVIVSKLQNIVTSAIINYPMIKDSCTKASLALSKIVKITSKAEDEFAEKVLTKVGVTYKEKSAIRLGITGEIDLIKEFLMGPEKTISTDPKATNSQYYRVKQLRNTWATDQKKITDKAAADLKLTQDKANHKAWISAEIERNIANGMFTAVTAVANWATTNWPTITLENIDAFEQKLTGTPTLKEPLYEGWFTVAYNSTFATAEEYKALQDEARAVHTYALKNTDFSTKAAAALKLWADKIPARKKELEDIAELAKTNAEAAKAQADASTAQAQTEATAQSNALEEERQDALVDISATENSAKLTNSFTVQAGLQSFAPTGGKVVKIGTITCPEEEVTQVVAELFYNCYLHPQFGGIIKKGKDGMYKFDANGRPEYTEEIEKWLKFYANNCPPTIAGIAISEEVNTSARAKK